MKKFILKNIILFTLLFLLGCIDKITLPEGPEFKFTSTEFRYDTNQELYLNANIENLFLIHSIDYVRAVLFNSDGLEISSMELEPDINGIVGQNVYKKNYLISELEYDVYTVTFTMKSESGDILLEHSGPKDLSPITASQSSQINSYTIFDLETGDEIVDDTVILDEHEWKELSFYLHVSDSNGFGDIDHVKYEIKGELSPCTEDANGDGEILGGEEWLDYVDGSTSGHEWEFRFADYFNVNGNYEASFIYLSVMRLRPRDGSALYDENGEIVPHHEATDCGRVGEVFLRFIVTDSSDDPTIIEDIPLIILAP